MIDPSNHAGLTRLRVENYKSIAQAAFPVGDLTILVGPNGAGKSNAVNALAFVADALSVSLPAAVESRGNVLGLAGSSPAHPNGFALRYDVALPGNLSGYYAFSLEAGIDQPFRVSREECRIFSPDGKIADEFGVNANGLARVPGLLRPARSNDSLYLTRLSDEEPFRTVFDHLRGLKCYNFSPKNVRPFWPYAPGEVLHNNGQNLVGAFNALDEESAARVNEYMAVLVPGLQCISWANRGDQGWLEFHMEAHADKTRRFFLEQMSDGTIRALAILVALFEHRGHGNRRIPLVAIEEPELGLHPGAIPVLFDAISEVMDERQVVVTTHSPELLDAAESSIIQSVIPRVHALSVELLNGQTVIGSWDEKSLELLRGKLTTPGELLRMNQFDIVQYPPANYGDKPIFEL
ncbi:MAG: ATP-binding protein [Opitutales bacterium]|nr:ATP-binding protein [Opitutales bacterium]